MIEYLGQTIKVLPYNQTGKLIPKVHSDQNGCLESTENPTLKQLLEKLKQENEKVRIDIADLSALIPGLTKAAIVISGPTEMTYCSIGSACMAEYQKN
ncbi:MAG: hypothetical protein NTU44_15065 [Bacteroidetes bacterium]|nr:hypothetical protein [Bacteroidota bacterium]